MNTIVKAAAVQISPVLYSRQGTVEKIVKKIRELGKQVSRSQPSRRLWFPTTLLLLRAARVAMGKDISVCSNSRSPYRPPRPVRSARPRRTRTWSSRSASMSATVARSTIRSFSSMRTVR